MNINPNDKNSKFIVPDFTMPRTQGEFKKLIKANFNNFTKEEIYKNAKPLLPINTNENVFYILYDECKIELRKEKIQDFLKALDD